MLLVIFDIHHHVCPNKTCFTLQIVSPGNQQQHVPCESLLTQHHQKTTLNPVKVNKNVYY